MRTWLVALAVVAACGPIAYVEGVTFTADDAVARARAAHADQRSPYYWTLATQYLHMARSVAAHADFQGANRFGRLATEAANRAEQEARRPRGDDAMPGDAARPSDPVVPAAAAGVRPGKDPP